MKHLQVATKAVKDIHDSLIDEGYNSHSFLNNEVWVVSPYSLLGRKTRHLNRELGIHLLNK